MSRPHVEFIQSQALAWQPSPWRHLPGCQVKLLSRDAESGAASALVRLPAGWAIDGAGFLTSGQEFLVLEGAMDVNGRRYEQDCYAWLPAGYPLRGCSTASGAIVLIFFDREPHLVEGAPESGRFDLAGAIEFRDAYQMEWESEGMDPAYAAVGLRWKQLRGSPHGRECTMLVACPPHLHPPHWRGPQEVHECVEEMYLLSGDYLSSLGTMYAGAYFWRPPGIAHGPYGTRGGNLAVIRTLGAQLENNWTHHEVALTREPSYQPSLPDGMRAHLRQPWRPQSY